MAAATLTVNRSARQRARDAVLNTPRTTTACCGVPMRQSCDCDFTVQTVAGLRRRRAHEGVTF